MFLLNTHTANIYRETFNLFTIQNVSIKLPFQTML